MVTRRLLVLLFALCASALVLPGVSAETTPVQDETDPEDVRIKTPAYRPDFDPALGTYTYEVSWQGIPAAEVKVGVERDGLRYRIWTKVRSYGAIDLFYKLRYEARSTLSAVDFSPQQSYFRVRENSKVKESELTFMPDGEIHAIRMKNQQDPEYKRFNPDNGTLDPFSAAFVARGVEWEVGKTNFFDAYNGRSRYLITMTAIDKITMDVNGVKRPVWVISPKVENLGKVRQSKLREAKIYLTADSFREILEIESEVYLGSVTTSLESFKATTKPQHGVQVAAHYLGEEISYRN